MKIFDHIATAVCALLVAASMFGFVYSAVLAEQKTWADYGDTRRVAAHRQDKVTAQEFGEPKYNLMQPNFWSQWEN